MRRSFAVLVLAFTLGVAPAAAQQWENDREARLPVQRCPP